MAGAFSVDIGGVLEHFARQSDGPWRRAAALHMIGAQIGQDREAGRSTPASA